MDEMYNLCVSFSLWKILYVKILNEKKFALPIIIGMCKKFFDFVFIFIE